MIQSMTGYGWAVSSGDMRQVTAELKAVNHRYCEVQIKLPKRYGKIEEKLRQYLAEKLDRGKIDLYIKVEAVGENSARLRVDKDLAARYHNAALEIAEEVGVPLNLSAFEMISLPGVISADDDTEDMEAAWNLIGPVVDEALCQLVNARETEGRRLAGDFHGRLTLMEAYRLKLLDYASSVVENYRKRLQARISELLGQQAVDESRLAQEAAMIADRAGVDEELVRLSSHFIQFRELLDADEPVGRKLDFICQEINREINTIGSKANDIQMTKIVVELKSELEKLREQTQNIK